MTFTAEAPEAWAARWIAAIRAHKIDEFLAEGRARFEAQYDQAMAQSVKLGLRIHGPPRDPTTPADQARASAWRASVERLIRECPDPTTAEAVQLARRRAPGQPGLAQQRGAALQHIAHAQPPLGGGSPVDWAWLKFTTTANQLVEVLHQLGRGELAEELAHGLVVLDPGSPEQWAALSHVRLRRGEYPAAWAALNRGRHLARWKFDRQRFGNVPAWVPGEPLHGRTLLVAPDIGLGDMLWFYRFVPLLAARGDGRVVVEARKELAQLSRTSFSGVAEVVDAPADGGGPPTVPFDTWCLPSSLAEAFAANPATLPNAAYLRADQLLVERWGAVIGQHPGFRVGLNWAGDPMIVDDPRRVTLPELAPLAEVAGASFFALQKTISISTAWQYPPNGGPEAEPTPDGMNLVRLGPQFEDMADTAAAMANLDLVITTDTSVAHLAGALGRPTWLLLRAWADPCWGPESETTFWYPSLRLFRQQRYGAWAPVVARVAAELAGLSQVCGVGSIEALPVPRNLIRPGSAAGLWPLHRSRR